MSGMNKYKKHLLCNEMKRNVKNIVLFLTHANFSTHAKILWTHATHATHATHTRIWIHATHSTHVIWAI